MSYDQQKRPIIIPKYRDQLSANSKQWVYIIVDRDMNEKVEYNVIELIAVYFTSV